MVVVVAQKFGGATVGSSWWPFGGVVSRGGGAVTEGKGEVKVQGEWGLPREGKVVTGAFYWWRLGTKEKGNEGREMEK
ncbi:unnamed protein product [Sphenostylis stenocarpa]|uniref:Uncharacterized protein n=1 Tax=Sphenostylis stenocarpa TaxID=92480 RepID=A0AA86VFE3_9FABA|nr:unnamed protein product [Sphenostylis stenocarpa]